MDANYNLAGLVDRIKAKLKDAEFSDEDIKQFIDDAYFETLGETRYQFLEKYYQQQVQESGAVLLPRDFQSAIILTANDGKCTTTLKYKPSQDFMANIGEPTNHYYYSVYGNKLFYGLPNISNDLDEDGDERFYSLNVYYQGKPAELVNDKQAFSRVVPLRQRIKMRVYLGNGIVVDCPLQMRLFGLGAFIKGAVGFG